MYAAAVVAIRCSRCYGQLVGTLVATLLIGTWYAEFAASPSSVDVASSSLLLVASLS